MSSIISGVFAILLSSLVTTALNFVYYPILTRVVGISSEMLGRYQFYISTSNVLAIFCVLSLNYAFVAERKEHSVDEAILFINTATLLTGIIYVVGVIVISVVVQLSPMDFLSVMIIGISEIFFLLSNTLLRDNKMFYEIGKITIYRSFANVIVGTGASILLKNEMTLVIALVTSSVLSSLLSIAKRFDAEFKFVLNFGYLSTFLKENRAIIVFQTAVLGLSTLTRNLPVFALKNVFGEGAVGLYSISVKLIGAAIAILSGALGQTFLPYFSKSFTDEQRIFYRFSLVSSTFFPILSIISILSTFYVPWMFGNDFSFASQIIRLMVPQYFMSATIAPFTSSIIAHGKSHYSFVLNLVHIAFAIALVPLSRYLHLDLWQMILGFSCLSILVNSAFMIISFKIVSLQPWKNLALNAFFSFCLYGLALQTRWSFAFLLGNTASLWVYWKNRTALTNIMRNFLSRLLRSKKRHK